MALDSERKRKRMRRYNLIFNILIFMVILIFFLLFFKVYNDYKTSQINDFIDYGIEQTKIVSSEIEKRLTSIINEIHHPADHLTLEDIQRKHLQIERAHSEINAIFLTQTLKELQSQEMMEKEPFHGELNRMIHQLESGNPVMISDTVFFQDNIIL